MFYRVMIQARTNVMFYRVMNPVKDDCDVVHTVVNLVKDHCDILQSAELSQGPL